MTKLMHIFLHSNRHDGTLRLDSRSLRIWVSNKLLYFSEML